MDVSKLENLAAVKIVIGCCCGHDVKKILYENLSPYKYINEEEEGMEDNEDEDKDKEENENYMSLPKEFDMVNGILKTKISSHIDILTKSHPIKDFIPIHLVPFVAMEMIEWSKYHCHRFGLSSSYCINFMKSSFFTNKGELDRALAAKELIKDKSLGLPLRIAIAIDYCLIEDIRLIWRDMTENERDHFRQKGFFKKYKFDVEEHYWSHFGWKHLLELANKETIEDSKNFKDLKLLCEYFLKTGKDVAFKNCWRMIKVWSGKEALDDILFDLLRKLEGPLVFENNKNFKYLTIKRSYVEILRFLLYDVDNPEEMMEILLKYRSPFTLIHVLLVLPNQEFFLKIINLLWEELSGFEFYCLLHCIVNLIESDYFCNTYNYKQLLWDLLISAPSHHRTYVFNCWESCSSQEIMGEYLDSRYVIYGGLFDHILSFGPSSYLLYRLFSLKTFTEKDVLNIQIIVQDISKDDKQMIVQHQGDIICSAALISGRPQLASFFIDCFVEKNSVYEYKRNFLNRKRNFIFEELISLGKHNIIPDIHAWGQNNNN